MIRKGLRDQDPGTIYVLQIGEFTKVGFTSKLEKRRRTYLAHNPLTPEFSHTEPGVRRDERMVQDILRGRTGDRVMDWHKDLTLYDAMKTIVSAKRKNSAAP